MIGLKSWPVAVVVYAVVAVTLFSLHRSSERHHHYSPDLFTSLLSKRDDTQELFFHINELGISGKGLLRFFKKHLLRIIDIDQREKAAKSADPHETKRVEVSQYYDLFRRYLYSNYTFVDNDVDPTGTCLPADSIVTKLTKGVNPLPLHSHNDYWRKLPLFEALAYGCSSIEADVWIVPENKVRNGDGSGSGDITDEFALAVGHNEAYLDPLHQTLDRLYTQPLKDMLDQVNCLDTSKKNGVFFNSPETTLFLYIDFKSKDSEMIYHLLMDKYLKPLIDLDYVSFFDTDTGKIVYNQITVILTGDYPKDIRIINNGNHNHGYYYTSKRHVFLDADILHPETIIPNTSITSSASFDNILEFCHISKVKTLWRGRLIHPDMHCIRSQIEKNHKENLKTRIWGVPSWPERTKKTLWRQQIYDLQSDLLNVDNLFLATKF